MCIFRSVCCFWTSTFVVIIRAAFSQFQWISFSLSLSFSGCIVPPFGTFSPICRFKWILSNSKLIYYNINLWNTNQHHTFGSWIAHCTYLYHWFRLFCSVSVVFSVCILECSVPYRYCFYACLIQLRNTFIHSLMTISMISNQPKNVRTLSKPLEKFVWLSTFATADAWNRVQTHFIILLPFRQISHKQFWFLVPYLIVWRAHHLLTDIFHCFSFVSLSLSFVCVCICVYAFNFAFAFDSSHNLWVFPRLYLAVYTQYQHTRTHTHTLPKGL